MSETPRFTVGEFAEGDYVIDTSKIGSEPHTLSCEDVARILNAVDKFVKACAEAHHPRNFCDELIFSEMPSHVELAEVMEIDLSGYEWKDITTAPEFASTGRRTYRNQAGEEYKR